ncbi:uncharacterized protein LOC132182112 [Corylus avellana]|uniref:uncharacterized protein LOC132182112 n=1 Tax=Corylus avellana TaxID=13451 RepID=UPI001E1F7060|nr:uncharacterized protein LOC132182112 [Corylus avellana]
MQATNFSSATLPLGPSWSSPSGSRRKPVNGGLLIVMSASGGRRDQHGRRDYGGRIVDENMILLRMRIRELKMSEMSQEPPASWMEWEKKYYTQYDEDVCEAVGLLQSYLLSIRPSLALGMAALVILSVPFSAGVLFFHALEMAKAIL